MSARTYWNLLVLFCVLCQGIIGTFSEKDIDELSEHLVRRKRVIDQSPGGDKREQIKDFPFVVSIARFRFGERCVGVILTHHIVLTAANCVALENGKYKVYSGKTQAVLSGARPVVHNVTDKRLFFSDHPFRRRDGIALLTVTPQFVYSINTRNIEFYDGPINQPGLHGSVSGWGCNSNGHVGTAHPSYLRSITVPIISNHDCKILYIDTLPIIDTDICTFDANGHKYCTIEDAGAPLVIETTNYEKFLLGIHLWNGGVVGRANPDVFMNLQVPRYRNWIRETITILEGSVHH